MIDNKEYSFEIGVVTENIPLLLAEIEVKKLQKISQISVHTSVDNHIKRTFSNSRAQKGIELIHRLLDINTDLFDLEEYRIAKTSIKEGKACGNDNVAPEVLKG